MIRGSENRKQMSANLNNCECASPAQTSLQDIDISPGPVGRRRRPADRFRSQIGVCARAQRAKFVSHINSRRTDGARRFGEPEEFSFRRFAFIARPRRAPSAINFGSDSLWHVQMVQNTHFSRIVCNGVICISWWGPFCGGIFGNRRDQRRPESKVMRRGNAYDYCAR